MSKRIMITRRGYCTIPGNLTDEEALAYAKVHLSPDDFDWEKPMLDIIEVGGADYDENNTKTDTTGFLEAVIVTLVRTRLEDPFHPEVCTDDFILFVPHDTTDVEAYAEKTFRAAAHYMLTDEHAGELIRESCSDFNWGDCATCSATSL